MIFKSKLFKKITPVTLFLIIGLAGPVSYFLALPFLGQHGIKWLVMENNFDYETADYFLTLLFSMGKENVYDFGIDACYTPLSYVFFYIFARITSLGELFQAPELLAMSYPELIDLGQSLLLSPYHVLIFILYLMLGLSLYIFAIDELDLPKRLRQSLTILVIFSTPLFAGALERGNFTLYTVGLLLVAFAYKDSSSSVKREMALICIALSAGLKLYPAAMGLLYLKEKRYKEAIRLIIYGAIAVFLPFLFCGGIDGLKTLLESFSILSGNFYDHRIQFFLGALTCIGIYGTVGKILNVCFIIVLVLLLFITKNQMRRMIYLAAIMAFYPPNSYRYTLLYFLIPLFVWLKEEAPACSYYNYVTALLFGCTFSIPTLFGFLTKFNLAFNYYTLSYVELFIYAAAWAQLAFQVFHEIPTVRAIIMRKKL